MGNLSYEDKTIKVVLHGYRGTRKIVTMKVKENKAIGKDGVSIPFDESSIFPLEVKSLFRKKTYQAVEYFEGEDRAVSFLIIVDKDTKKQTTKILTRSEDGSLVRRLVAEVKSRNTKMFGGLLGYAILILGFVCVALLVMVLFGVQFSVNTGGATQAVTNATQTATNSTTVIIP
jgi:hypothetical protein